MRVTGNFRVLVTWPSGHQWNEVRVPLGALADKKITTLIVAYDQAANTGGYRGPIDYIKITG
jgi:hypothetical protein